MTTQISLDDQRSGGPQAIPVVEGPSSASANPHSGTIISTLARPNIRGTQEKLGSQNRHGAAEQTPRPAITGSATLVSTPGGAPSSGDVHYFREAQEVADVAAPAPERSIAEANSGPEPTARVSTPSPPARALTSSNEHPPVVTGPLARHETNLLSLAADVLDDLERVRIGNENRYRQLTRTEVDSDGEERGFGLDDRHPDVKRLRLLVEALADAEHQAQLNLQRLMRQHPLGPWVKQARGVGEKQAARLIAAIGDPYWNTLYDRPRTVSELWAYCGYHVLRTGHTTADDQSGFAGPAQAGSNPDQGSSDTQIRYVGVAAARARGQRANWSPDAKMRAYLVAVSIVKAGGPYRDVYDTGREKYIEAVHQVECKRCGPSGKPALVGSPISAGHQHARALRLVAKQVLKDLWLESKRLHELRGDGQPVFDDHDRNAAAAGTTSQEIA